MGGGEAGNNGELVPLSSVCIGRRPAVRGLVSFRFDFRAVVDLELSPDSLPSAPTPALADPPAHPVAVTVPRATSSRAFSVFVPESAEKGLHTAADVYGDVLRDGPPTASKAKVAMFMGSRSPLIVVLRRVADVRSCGTGVIASPYLVP